MDISMMQKVRQKKGVDIKFRCYNSCKSFCTVQKLNIFSSGKTKSKTFVKNKCIKHKVNEK